MQSQLFEIYYSDGLKPGVKAEEAIKRLCDLFKVSPSKAEQMLVYTQRVIKSGLNRQQAEKYVTAMDGVGMKVEMRESQPAVEKSPNDSVQQPVNPVSENGSTNPQLIPENNGAKAVTGERVLPVEFNGQGFEYFKIWIVNIFLTIITVGIYSAWAKVRNKQYFYGNTVIDGSSFKYTAKPITILKGRLIAVAFFVLYAVINQVMPLLGLAFLLLLMVAFPWIIVRSLAFNARNSVYRNIRFNFTGTKVGATKTFLLWPVLILPTLGFILPYIWCKQQHYFVNNSAYGTTAFEFRATAGEYYRIFFIALGILIAGGAFLVIANFVTPLFIILSVPLAIALYLILFSYFAAALGNLYFNSTVLDSNSFASQLQMKHIAWLYFTNTLGIVLTLGLFIPWAKVRMASYRASCLHLHAQGALDDFIAAEREQVSALGEQVGEVFDMDVSII